MANDAPSPEVVLRSTRLDSTGDLALVRQLFQLNGYPRSDTEMAWVYEPCCGSAGHASLAESAGSVAALYAAVSARFKVGDDEVPAAQSLDTMVDSRFRGMGLFTKMARAVNADMAQRGVSFVYGFPNGNSFPGFVGKLGWHALDPVPFLFRPIKAGFAVAKLSKAFGSLARFNIPVFGASGKSRELAVMPDAGEINSLWEGFSSQVVVARVRDHEFMSHRYANHPRAKYRYRACYRERALSGLIIYCIEEKHGGRVGYVMELMCLPGETSSASQLLADTLSDMRDAGCDGALAWCFSHSPYHGRFLRQGFLPLPTSLRPIELHFGYLGLSNAPDRLLAERRNWYLSYSDSDTV